MTDAVNNNTTGDAINQEAEATAADAMPQETVAEAAETAGRPPELLVRLQTLEQEVQKNLTGWQRERADFTNYKRRIEKEVKEARERGAHEAITRLLPLMDDFERALQNVPADLREHPWVNGTALILKKFDKVLDEFMVEVIDPVGEPFDPHRHEAIGTDASSEECPPGHVTVTLQKGYASGERVLRPALVRVAG